MTAYVQVISCRATLICRKCKTRLVGPIVQGSEWDAESALGQEAARLGWRVFASNTRLWYCPEHGPSAASKAYEVTP